MYRCSKQHSEPTSDKRGARVDELRLTPLELIERIADLVPPPRAHRHRYFGVLAPNSPLRAAVTALAQAAAVPLATAQAEPAIPSEGALGLVPQGKAVLPTPGPAPPKQLKAHYLWVDRPHLRSLPVAVSELRWADAHHRLSITHGADIGHILEHIGVDSEPPQISPVRRPPLCDGCGAQTHDELQIEPDWDLPAQPAPDYEVDQRFNW